MSQLSDLLSRHNPPSPDTDPTAGPADTHAGLNSILSASEQRANRWLGWAKNNPRATVAVIVGIGVVSAAGIVLRPKPTPVSVTLAAVKAPVGGHTGKSAVTPLVAPSAGSHPAGAAAPLAPVTLAPTPAAQQAQQAQARALFLQASQGSVELARIQPVRDGLFAVAYVVNGRSGQAWVDVPAKVVFVGAAVDATGQMLTPGAVTMAQGAITPTPAAGGSAAATPAANPGVLPGGSVLAHVPPVTQAPTAVMGHLAATGTPQPLPLTVAMAQVIKDQQAGFWDGAVNAPRKIWAFTDPDNPASMLFFKAMKPLIHENKVRVYWIPVGVYDPSSADKSAYILSQLGPAHALSENYASFVERGNSGASPLNRQSDTMAMRVIENNRLLTSLGRLELPAVVTCGAQGGLVTLYKPTPTSLMRDSGPCSKDILSLAGLAS